MWSSIIFKYPTDETEDITSTHLGLITLKLLFKCSSAVNAPVINQFSPHLRKTAVHRDYQFIPLNN